MTGVTTWESPEANGGLRAEPQRCGDFPVFFFKK